MTKKTSKKAAATTTPTATTTTTTEDIKLSDIIVGEPNVQQRVVTTNMGTVQKYANMILDDYEFPPLTVYRVGDRLILADGYHRFYAYVNAKHDTAPCEVLAGTLDDAILYAATANGKYGLRMSNADKRMAVCTVLDLKPDWSDHRIAEAVGVTQPFVSNLRKYGNKSTDNGYQELPNVLTDNDRAQVVDDLTTCTEFADAGGDPAQLQEELQKVLSNLRASRKAALKSTATHKPVTFNDAADPNMDMVSGDLPESVPAHQPA